MPPATTESRVFLSEGSWRPRRRGGWRARRRTRRSPRRSSSPPWSCFVSVASFQRRVHEKNVSVSVVSVSVIHALWSDRAKPRTRAACRRGRGRARDRMPRSRQARGREVARADRGRARAFPLARARTRASTRAIARLKSHGDGFSICRTHLATTCCLRTAFTDTERLTVVDRGLGGRRSVHVLESLAKPETSSAPRVSVVSARPRRVRDARMNCWFHRGDGLHLHVPGSAARREEILRAATLAGRRRQLEATMAAIFVVVWCA